MCLLDGQNFKIVKIKILIKSLIISLLFISCSEDESGPSSQGVDLELDVNQNRLDSIMVGFNNSEIQSDNFSLYSAKIVDSTLYIGVGYSGGCKSHQFELVWPEVINAIFPPDFSVILLHDANGDQCEAFLQELIEFDLSKNELGLSTESLEVMRLTIINGSNPDETVSNR